MVISPEFYFSQIQAVSNVSQIIKSSLILIQKTAKFGVHEHFSFE